MTTVMQRMSAHHHGGTLSSFAPFESRAMNSVSLVSVCKGTGLVEQRCNTGPSSAMTLLFLFCSLFVPFNGTGLKQRDIIALNIHYKAAAAGLAPPEHAPPY